jgi:hypothetical protein
VVEAGFSDVSLLSHFDHVSFVVVDAALVGGHKVYCQADEM